MYSHDTAVLEGEEKEGGTKQKELMKKQRPKTPKIWKKTNLHIQEAKRTFKQDKLKEIHVRHIIIKMLQMTETLWKQQGKMTYYFIGK